MKASRFTDAQKAFILKQGADGVPVGEVCRRAGVSQATYFNWQKKYEALTPPEMRRLKQLEDENAKLKKLVAELCKTVCPSLSEVACSLATEPAPAMRLYETMWNNRPGTPTAAGFIENVPNAAVSDVGELILNQRLNDILAAHGIIGRSARPLHPIGTSIRGFAGAHRSAPRPTTVRSLPPVPR